MKKILLVLLTILMTLLSQAQVYYYSGGKQIALQLDTSQVVVQLQNESSLQSTQQKAVSVANYMNISNLQMVGG